LYSRRADKSKIREFHLLVAQAPEREGKTIGSIVVQDAFANGEEGLSTDVVGCGEQLVAKQEGYAEGGEHGISQTGTHSHLSGS